MSVGLISVNAAGTASGNSSSMLGAPFPTYAGDPPSGQAAISANGSLVAFQSDATDLVAGVNDTNKASDAFVRNLSLGQTQLISSTTDGQVGNGSSVQPIISPDGRYVAFLSSATNLAGADSVDPSMSHLYVRDLATQKTTLLDVSSDGAGAGADRFATGKVAFSPDSKTLAFSASSTNFAAGDPATMAEWIYLRHLDSGTTTAVSVTPDGTLSKGDNGGFTGSSDLVFSPDSQKLAFTSTATDLTANSQDNSPAPWAGAMPVTNLYVRDLSAGTTTLVNSTPDGHFANGTAMQPVFSPDGRHIAFLSNATNLTGHAAAPNPNPGDPAAAAYIQNLFIRDLAGGTTTLITASTSGTTSAGTVMQAAFSPDGRSLAFISSGHDLTNNPSEPSESSGPRTLPYPAVMTASQVYVHDMATNSTKALSATPDGKLSNGYAYNLRFSPDGNAVAYLSNGTDLTSNPPPTFLDSSTAGSPNGKTKMAQPPHMPATNLFLSNVSSGVTTAASVTPGGSLSHGYVSMYAFSPNGQELAFVSTGDDLTNNPADSSANPGSAAPLPFESSNVFVRNLATLTTTLVSATPEGTLSNDATSAWSAPLFTADGQDLIFAYGGKLLDTDDNQTSDLYVATAPFANPGEIHFATWQYHGELADGQVKITVVRDAPFDTAAAVSYAVHDDTAKKGNDYQATSGTLNFAPGQSSATFTIPLNAAASFKNVKTAKLVLSNPTGAPLGTPTATLYLGGVMRTTPRLISTPGSAPWTTIPTSLAKGSTPVGVPPHVTTPPPKTGNHPTTTPDAVTSATGSKDATGNTATGSKDATGNAATGSKDATGNAATGSKDATGIAATVGTPTPINAASNTTSTTIGPVVVGLTTQSNRRKINGVVLRFSEALSVAAAGNPANYSVHLLARGRRARKGQRTLVATNSVEVSAAKYDAATHQVVLTFRSSLRKAQMFQLTANGGQGGITDEAGNPLNSQAKGAAGSHFVYNHNVKQ